MKISQKLVLGFALILLFAIVVGVIGIYGMDKMRASNRLTYERQVYSLEYIGKATAALKQTRIEFRQVAICSYYDDLKGANDAKKQFEIKSDEFLYWLDACRSTAASDELIRFYDSITLLFIEGYRPKVEAIVNQSIEDTPGHINKLYNKVLLASAIDVNEQIESLVEGSMDLNAALVARMNDDNERLINTFMWVQALLLGAAVIVAAAVAYIINRDVSAPIGESAGVLKRIADGDFNARVSGDYKGDLEIIKNSVNDTAEKLSLYLTDKLEAERAAYDSKIGQEKANAVKEAILSGLTYASRIQKSLLPRNTLFQKAFSDHSIIWEPRDIVGGDIYWLKDFEDGALLCVCDCTGHGTPGALLTMLVASAFDAIVNESNYKDTAQIIWLLDQRVSNVLNAAAERPSDEIGAGIRDGCDLAVLFFAKDGSINVSSGHTHVFVCDGEHVTRIKGQKLYVGEGRIESKEEIEVITIPANPENKVYVASDGIFDQIGGEMRNPFGYNRFKRLILENHIEEQEAISQIVWDEFERYRGREIRRDDAQLITIRP